MPPPDRRLAALLCLAVVAFAGARLAVAPGLLGSPGAEVYGHAWVQWWQGDAWPRLATGTRLLDPRHDTAWAVIDPLVTWVAAGLGRLAGAVAAWDVVALGAVALAFAGGWTLAVAIGGDPWTGALALALGPVFVGSLASGLTEDWSVGLVALALAALERRRPVVAGALLGLLPWTGLYLALQGAFAAAVLAVADVARTRDPRAGARTWGPPAAIALLLTLPVAWFHGERLEGVGHRSGVPGGGFEPHWRINPHHGADLLSFVVPGPDPVHDDALVRVHPAYLGLLVLGLAVTAGRRDVRWWVILAVAVLVAPGVELMVAGYPTGVPNPLVAALTHLPLLGLVNHWGRLLLVGQVALAALASLGVARLKRDGVLGRAGASARAWLPALVVLDYAVLSPAPLPLPVASADVPAVFSSLGSLPPGGLVVVPSAGPGVAFQQLLWFETASGRPTFLSPNRPGYGTAETVPLVRWFAGLVGDRREPPDPQVDRSMAELRRLGAAAIVVRDPYVADVAGLLGPPDVTAEGGAAWAVR